MAHESYSGGSFINGSFISGGNSTTVVDKDAFEVDGKTYRYDRKSQDKSHVCVKQNQPGTD